MTFANPMALFGLAAVAVPVAVHLLARHRGPRTGFPTLRFFQVDRLVALRRYQLTDLLLLAVRIAVIIFAALALAGPRLSIGRSALVRVQPATAILLDTSKSLSRPGRDGKPALDSARTEAARIARSSNRATTLETTDLRNGVAGAVAWLETQAEPRELAIVSDFQRGALSAADLARVPASMGIDLIRVEAVSPASVSAPPVWRNDANGKLRQETPRITLSSTQTDVTWIDGPNLAADSSPTFDLDPMLAFVASASDTPRALTALRAAMGQGARSGSREQPVAMVFVGAAGHGALWDAAQPLDRPWMADVVRRLIADGALREAARRTRASAKADLREGLVPVLRDEAGEPLVIAASGEVGHAHRLLLFVEGDAASLASALVMGATLAATSTDAPIGEFEPLAIDADTLRSWERPATDATPDQRGPIEPVGRWVWAIVLVWLGVETWMRQRDSRDRQGDDGARAGTGREVDDRVA